MVQRLNNKGSFDVDFLDYILEELIEQPGKSCHRRSSIVATTEASILFSVVLPMGESAVASSSQPVPYCDSNSNCNDTTSITSMTSIANLELVHRSMIVASGMWVRD
jgi:hypothetical protein